MIYRITFERSADVDALDAWRYIRERSPLNADQWLLGLIEATRKLAEFPRACSIAIEDDRFDEEIRQMPYKGYRVLFTIRGEAVHILHVRHAARLPMERDEQIGD